MASLVDYASDSEDGHGSSTSVVTALASPAASLVGSAALATAPPVEKASRQLAFCGVGDCAAAARYTCPACGTRFCTVACGRTHKEEDGCTGKRNPAAAVSLGSLAPAQLQNVLL